MKALRRTKRASLGEPPEEQALQEVLVVSAAFPVAGGIRSVLTGLAAATEGRWHITYLTRHIGANPDHLPIVGFGRGNATNWQFPNVWLYVLAGFRALLRLARSGRRYRVILPQDGVSAGFFAALYGRLAGVRIVCMDHGALTVPYSDQFRRERMATIRRRALPARLVAHIRLACYWPTLRFMARTTARLADHFLVAGDEVEGVLRGRFGVKPERITRYSYIVNTERFRPLPPAERASLRRELNIAEDAIVITMINRLAPEKGLDTAIEALQVAFAQLDPAARSRVRVVIVGHGPARPQLEEQIAQLGLSGACLLYGEAGPQEVASLLGLSDVFLYTGLRGTNVSMAVLEAMASGCAVVATTSPISNARLLAEGRGIAVSPGDVGAIADALAHLVRNEGARREIGALARPYVEAYHAAAALRQALAHATALALTVHSAEQPASLSGSQDQSTIGTK